MLWIIGIAIFLANNGSMGAVYAGRFIAGIGIGQTVVVGPVYISEISPAPIRGLCTCVFTGAVYLGILLAYAVNYAAEVDMNDTFNRWVRAFAAAEALSLTSHVQAVPTSLHLMFAGVILILSIFQMESPRYLIRANKREKALETLCKFRGVPPDRPYVLDEITAIDVSFQEEKEATMGMGWMGVLKEVFTIRRNVYRLFLTNLAQVLACWSGGNSITVYAPDLFQLVGITGERQSLFSSVIFGVVKLVSSVICALFLIDAFGRKRALITGIIIQTVALFYVAIFLNLVPVANNPGFTPTSSQNKASGGAIAMIYIAGVGWALGWNSGQYLLSSELFPLRIRAVCSSITMGMHFLMQYATNRALPNMLLEHHGLTPHGTFYFFGVVSIVGGIWVWMCVPEAAGRSLEGIDKMFDLPWYKIGRHGRKFAEEYDQEQELNQRNEKMEAVSSHREEAA